MRNRTPVVVFAVVLLLAGIGIFSRGVHQLLADKGAETAGIGVGTIVLALILLFIVGKLDQS